MLWGLTALLALQLAGEVVVRFFHWPVPGPMCTCTSSSYNGKSIFNLIK